MQEARGSSPLSSTAQDLASGQVRSSLDRSHPSRRVGSFSVLGGIWEINYAPVGLARELSWGATPLSDPESGRQIPSWLRYPVCCLATTARAPWHTRGP